MLSPRQCTRETRCSSTSSDAAEVMLLLAVTVSSCWWYRVYHCTVSCLSALFSSITVYSTPSPTYWPTFNYKRSINKTTFPTIHAECTICAFGNIITLRTVYCNRSCLWVCDSGRAGGVRTLLQPARAVFAFLWALFSVTVLTGLDPAMINVLSFFWIL